MVKSSLWITSSLVLVALLVTACSRRFDPQADCNFVQNANLQRVSWNRSLPIKLYIHKSIPLNQFPEMESQIRSAAESWNRVTAREVFRIEAFNVGGSDVPQRDGYNMIYWMSTWERDRRQEQARTTIYWSGSQIYEADVRINALNYQYFVGMVFAPFTQVDFTSLLIHELGHAVGLAHNQSKTSVMQAELERGLERRNIGPTDLDSIRCEYN